MRCSVRSWCSITRLRQKIVALTIVTLVVSVVKIAYESHVALPSGQTPVDIVYSLRPGRKAIDKNGLLVHHRENTLWLNNKGLLRIMASPLAVPSSEYVDDRWSNLTLFLQDLSKTSLLPSRPLTSWERRDDRRTSFPRDDYMSATNLGGDGFGNEMAEINNDNALDTSGKGKYSRVPTSSTDGMTPVSRSQAPAARSQGWQGEQETLNSKAMLVILVCSKPENTGLRLAIRRTWGLDLDPAQVMVRFFIGQDDGWDKIIEREETIHHDVVRTEYWDTYDNLSYKVLAALHWSLTHFRTARYVMKVDDDTYLNLPYLLYELRNSNRSFVSDVKKRGGDISSYVIGAVCVDSPVVREEGNKWFVSDLDYPSDVYPNYVFGGGYVMTRSAVEALLAASLQTEYLHLEDVYITGILARLGGVTLLSHSGFSFWTSRRATPCDVVSGRRMTSVNMTSKQFSDMYSGIHAILRAGNWTQC